MAIGAPPLYKTAEELEYKIQEYFNQDGVKETISGLCYYLGFASRQSFYDLEKKEAFAYTIKRARLRLETHYEELLNSNRYAGAIFALKNFGWKDTQEIDYSGSVDIKPKQWIKSDGDKDS